eukprot:gene15167-20430_t
MVNECVSVKKRKRDHLETIGSSIEKIPTEEKIDQIDPWNELCDSWGEIIKNSNLKQQKDRMRKDINKIFNNMIDNEVETIVKTAFPEPINRKALAQSKMIISTASIGNATSPPTMFMLTNRNYVNGQFNTDCSSTIKLGIYDGTNQGVIFENNYREILRQHLEEASVSRLLFFIHGYNNSIEKAAATAWAIGQRLQADCIIFFSWPSHGKWESYFADRENARLSAPQMFEALMAVSDIILHGNIHILAHSMGNYVFSRALEHGTDGVQERRVQLQGRTFGHYFSAAADHSQNKFHTAISDYFGSFTSITIYMSDADLALDFSKKIFHNFSNRVGLFKPVFQKDTDNYNKVMCNCISFEIPRTREALVKHSYFKSTSVVEDMRSIINRLTPVSRATRRGENVFSINYELDYTANGANIDNDE